MPSAIYLPWISMLLSQDTPMLKFSRAKGIVNSPLKLDVYAATWILCYKTYHVRSLLMSVISQSVYPWQTFPAYSYVCDWGHYTRLEMPARSIHSSLLRTLENYGPKRFYNIGPSQEQKNGPIFWQQYVRGLPTSLFLNTFIFFKST